jgi:hypothetical protein
LVTYDQLNIFMSPENKLTRRKFITQAAEAAALGTLASLLPQNLLHDEKPESVSPTYSGKPQKFLLMGDIHLGNSDGGIRQTNTQVEPVLRSVVNNLKNNPYDFFVHLGDAIKEQESEQANIANYSTCIEILQQFPFPSLHLPANHDLWGITDPHLRSIFRKFGLNEFYGVREFTDYQIVWLDLVAPRGVHGWLPEERIDWLKKTIYPDTPTFIFSHYGILPQDPRGNIYFENSPQSTALANGATVWRALENLPIKAVISAHMHWGAHFRVNQTHMLTIPAFIENIASPRQSDPPPGIYSTLSITNPDKFTLQSYFGNNCFMNIEAEL